MMGFMRARLNEVADVLTMYFMKIPLRNCCLIPTKE